ncbi:MAG: phytanoyl-CoA dioxygenase family protein [Actinomycetota bacterium]
MTDVVDQTSGLSAQQIAFFEAFGFVHVHGLFVDDLPRIEAGFEEAFAAGDQIALDPDNALHNTNYDGYDQDIRTMVFGFIDHSDNLSWLRDDPRITAIVTSLIGPNFEYAESDGNRFNCDVWFHSDVYGSSLANENLKLYFYLDELTEETGALRVFPGTHHLEGDHAQTLRGAFFRPGVVEDKFGMPQRDLPAYAIETRPGDMIVSNFRTLHGSFGGAVGRRLFTLNFKSVV